MSDVKRFKDEARLIRSQHSDKNFIIDTCDAIISALNDITRTKQALDLVVKAIQKEAESPLGLSDADAANKLEIVRDAYDFLDMAFDLMRHAKLSMQKKRATGYDKLQKLVNMW